MAALYPEAQIVHTADGLVFVVDTEAGPTVSICARLTIKNLDYDPITEAFKYEDQMAERAARKTRIKEERAKREALLAERRKKKLDEIAAKMADKASAE